VIRYEIRLGNGHSLHYEEQTKYHPEPHPVGGRLALGWMARDAVILKGE